MTLWEKYFGIWNKTQISRRRLKMAAQRARPDISPELMNALDFLLK